MENASVKIDALFAIAEFKHLHLALWELVRVASLEAAWHCIAPGPCGTLTDSSSIKCVTAVGGEKKK